MRPEITKRTRGRAGGTIRHESQASRAGDRQHVDGIECDVTQDESVTRALATVRQRYSNRLASVIHLTAYYDFQEN